MKIQVVNFAKTNMVTSQTVDVGLILEPFPKLNKLKETSWLHRASNNVETFSLPTDVHNVKKHRVIKTF